MKKNIELWESLYKSGKNYLKYPDEAFLKLYFSNVGDMENLSCLDFGAGSGAVSEFLCDRNNSVLSFDTSESAREILRQRLSPSVQVVNQDGLAKIQDNSLDLIVAWHVLYYLEQDELKQRISDFKRWLKAGGVMIATFLGERDAFLAEAEQLDAERYRLQYNGQGGAEVSFFGRDAYQTLFDFAAISVGESIYSFEQRVNHYDLVVVKKGDWATQ